MVENNPLPKLIVLREILWAKIEIAKRWKSFGCLIEGQAEILDTLNIARHLNIDGTISLYDYQVISLETKAEAIAFMKAE